MIGGQVVDLEAEHTKPTAEMLEYIHRSKTAALITASLVSGGIYAGGKDSQVAKLRAFGLAIGLAFQIVDDVLDVTQTSAQLGKTAGKDTASEKATYPALFGIEASLRKADALVNCRIGGIEQLRGARGHIEGTGAISGRAEESKSALRNTIWYLANPSADRSQG